MADSNQIIGATIQVDSASVKEASKSTADLKANIKDLKKQFDAQKTGSAEQVEAYKKLKTAQDDLAKSTKNAADAAEGGGVHFGELREKIAGMGGPLGEASEGVGKLNLSFKALLANPVVLIITAIVGALALLYKAFTNTFEGAEKVEQIFAGIKAAAQALLDNIGHVASAIAKVFSFDFSGAVAEIKQVGDAVADAYNAMADLTKKAQELHKEQLQNDLEQAERQKKLAVLRSQAQDEDVPVAKRKAALKELLAASEENAKQDVDLAKRTTANKLAQLTLEKDGAKKNQDEINKLKIDQIHVETDAANEVRLIRRSLTQATKQELADEKAARDKAAEDNKKRRQELVDFINRLNKIQQENDLAGIKDTYEQQKKQIQNQIDDQKRQTQVDLQDKKITADQAAQLDAALEQQRLLKLDALADKHNKEVADKEAAFQKDLAAIKSKASVDGVVDQRAKERQQIQATYQQQLLDATQKYKDNAAQLHQIQQALAEEYHAEDQALTAKFQKEDADKAFKDKLSYEKGIAQDQSNSFKDRLAAVATEQAITQKAFDDKVISEQEYNEKTAEFARDRVEIGKQETEQRKQQLSQFGQSLSAISDLIGKQTIAGKALGIATALINTYQGASEALKQKSVLPSPFDVIAKVAAVAAVIATGIKTVQAITAVNVPGGSGGASAGAGAPPSISAPAAPVAPTQSSTVFNAQANAAAIASNPTTSRSYVLDSDIQDAAERNARLNRAARLGGN